MQEEKLLEKTKHRKKICPFGIASLEPCTLDCEWSDGDECAIWQLVDALNGIRAQGER